MRSLPLVALDIVALAGCSSFAATPPALPLVTPDRSVQVAGTFAPSAGTALT